MLNIGKRKKRYITSYVLLFVAFILQTTLVRELSVLNVAPSLLLVLAVCFSLVNDEIASAVFSLVAGFLLDISSGRVLGFNGLLMMYMSLAIAYFGQDYFRDTSRSAAFLVMICTLVYETLFSVFNFAIFGEGSVFYVLLKVVLIETLYNGIIAMPVFVMCRKFMRIKTGRSLFD